MDEQPDVSHAVGDARKRLLEAAADLPNHDEVHGHADGWEGDDT